MSAPAGPRRVAPRANGEAAGCELMANALAAASRRARSRVVRPEGQGAATRRAGHHAQRRAGQPGRDHRRRPGAAPGSAARDLARRGDQHPPGAPEHPRPVREPAVRRPPPAASPPGAVADRQGVRRRRAGGPDPVDRGGHPRDPRALPARAGALRPPHRPGRGHLRRRLTAADLVLAGSPHVCLRGAVRAARPVDPAAGDPEPQHGQLGGVHPRHRGAAVVALLRPAPDRRAAADLGGSADPQAPDGRADPGARTGLPLLPRRAGDAARAAARVRAQAVRLDRLGARLPERDLRLAVLLRRGLEHGVGPLGLSPRQHHRAAGRGLAAAPAAVAAAARTGRLSPDDHPGGRRDHSDRDPDRRGPRTTASCSRCATSSWRCRCCSC